MTDEKTTTTPSSTPGTFVCPEDGCHVLIPDTLEDRREHRSGHAHDKKTLEAIRRRLRELQEDFDTLRGWVREQMGEVRKDVEGIDREVGKIEIPTPVPPLTITRGGWDDEDEPVDDPDDDEDDWGVRTPAVPEPTIADPTSGEPAESGADDLDETEPASTIKPSAFAGPRVF